MALSQPVCNPRPATPEELEALAIAQGQHDEGPHFVFDPADMVLPRWVAVFDFYISDSPGYHGKVAVVIWGAGPDVITSFVQRQGKWEVASECIA